MDVPLPSRLSYLLYSRTSNPGQRFEPRGADTRDNWSRYLSLWFVLQVRFYFQYHLIPSECRNKYTKQSISGGN
ncbi:hypothetical protein E2C01_035943 [Portunus trituberculatus]|uniref:Uncharacterized protein n=1 Tax=Portunus trituberculatus TaxID=210409 RepID=A0A5B7FCU2_PORTR|nr:hypothetical protein [Portunus trituberculatus]